MEELLDTNIKDIINQYPTVNEALLEYNIACVSCNVGTCRLRDIIEIHNLTLPQEKAIMSRIAKAVFPNREIELPTLRRKPQSTTIKLSPPLNKLVREHSVIKKLVFSIPFLAAEFEENPSTTQELIEEGLDFIRRYADRFHHAKEEDVLFKYFDENAEIFQVMYKDHEQARSHVRQTHDALEKGDDKAVLHNLHAYGDLLKEHIQKEDEVLYPWIDRNLTDSQVGELFTKFSSIDEEFGNEPSRHERYIGRLEKRYGDEIANDKKKKERE